MDNTESTYGVYERYSQDRPFKRVSTRYNVLNNKEEVDRLLSSLEDEEYE